MPPMQSMFGGMRAAGQDTRSQEPEVETPGGAGKEPEVEGPEVEGPEDQVEGPKWTHATTEAEVHRYRNGRLVKCLPTKPPKAARKTWPIGERTYKAPGSGYALGRDYIDAVKALKSRY